MKYNEYDNITGLFWDKNEKTLLGVSVDENNNENYIDLSQIFDQKFLNTLETHINTSDQHTLVNEQDNGFMSSEMLFNLNDSYNQVTSSNILQLDRQLIENILNLKDYTVLDLIDYTINNGNISIKPFKYIYQNRICVSQTYVTSIFDKDVIYLDGNRILKRKDLSNIISDSDLFVVDLEYNNMVKPVYKIYCNSNLKMLDILKYNIDSYTNLNPYKSLVYGEMYDKDNYMNYICSIDFERDDVDKATGRSLSKNSTYCISPIGQVHKSSTFEGDYIHIPDMRNMTLTFTLQKNELGVYNPEKIFTFLDTSTNDILSIHLDNNGLFINYLNKPILIYENIESNICKGIIKYQDNSLSIQLDGDPVGRMINIDTRNMTYFVPCFKDNMISHVNLFDRIINPNKFTSNAGVDRLDGFIQNGLICRKKNIYIDKSTKDSGNIKIVRDLNGNLKNIRLLYNGDGNFLKCTTNIPSNIICNNNDISIDINKDTDSLMIETVYISPFINSINTDIHKLYLSNNECYKDNNICMYSNMLRNTVPNKKFSRECTFNITDKFTKNILNTKVIKNMTFNIEGEFGNNDVYLTIDNGDKIQLKDSHYIHQLDIKNLKDFNAKVICKDSANIKVYKMYVNIELYSDSYICKIDDKVENIVCLSNNFVNSLNDNLFDKIEIVYKYEPPYFIDRPKENTPLVVKTYKYEYYIEDNRIFKIDKDNSKCYTMYNRIVGGGY